MLVYLLVRSFACARRHSFLTWWAAKVVENVGVGERKGGGVSVRKKGHEREVLTG